MEERERHTHTHIYIGNVTALDETNRWSKPRETDDLENRPTRSAINAYIPYFTFHPPPPFVFRSARGLSKNITGGGPGSVRDFIATTLEYQRGSSSVVSPLLPAPLSRLNKFQFQPRRNRQRGRVVQGADATQRGAKENESQVLVHLRKPAVLSRRLAPPRIMQLTCSTDSVIQFLERHRLYRWN